MRRLLLIPLLVAGLGAGSASHAAPTAPAPRILYAGDWAGPMQIFAVDPSRRAPLGEVTFGRTSCSDTAVACGFGDPVPSPDGKRILYSVLYGTGAPHGLWVARADGRSPRLVGVTPGAPNPAWAADSSQFAYLAGSDLHVVRADGSGGRLVRRSWCFDWAPDGHELALLRTDTAALVLLRGGRERLVARQAACPAWSADGKWTAYATAREIRLAAPLGAAEKSRLVARGEDLRGLEWSHDGRLLAFLDKKGVRMADLRTGRELTLVRAEDFPHTSAYPSTIPRLAWSPVAYQLAISAWGAASVIDVRTGRTLVRIPGESFALAWAPDGRSLAFIEGAGVHGNRDDASTGDLKVVTLSGRVRTVIRADALFGGQMVSLAWTRPAQDVTYRAPQQVDGVFAGGPAGPLAADGGRVGFVACGHVLVWSPPAGDLARFPDDRPRGTCPSTARRDQVYAVALAGARVAWGEKTGGLTFRWELRGSTLDSEREPFTLATGSGAQGNPFNRLRGAGSLLAFSSWPYPNDPRPTVIYRAGPLGCPCPAIASSPPPLHLVDVDGGRVVVGGENATWVLDSEGALLSSIPGPLAPDGGQLAESDLVIARGGGLQHYDARSGALVRTWPTSAGSSLQDAARGLVVYVLDGRVHLLRLVDGSDAVVARGALARFMDEGLVYADGARLHLVPFDQLPLR